MRSKQSPSEGRIDKRMTALGVVGFLALAGVFFLLGLFPIGKMIKSYMSSRAQAPQTVYSPPVHRHSETQTQAQAEPQQPLDLEITEQGQAQTSPEDQAQSGDEGVKQDDNSLTITLDPNEPSSEPAAKPVQTERPRSQATRRETSSTERPRASTEGTHPAPASDRIYRVQAGTFASKANAETLSDDLKGRGYHPEIKLVQTQGSALYRVQLGGYRNQEGAKDLAKDLSNDGYAPTLITEKAE